MGVEAMASIAFMMRLSRTCCNWIGSPDVEGRSVARSTSVVIRRPISSLRKSVIVELTSSLTSIRSEFLLAFLEQAAEAVNDLAGPIVFVNDVLQRVPDLGKVR